MSTRSRTGSAQRPPFQAVYYPPWLGWPLPRTLTPSQANHLYLHIKTVAYYLDALTAFIPQTRDSPVQVSNLLVFLKYLNSANPITPFSSNPISSDSLGRPRTHHRCVHPSRWARARRSIWVLHHFPLSHIRN